MINENVIFDYLVSVDFFKSVDDTFLHMPLSMISMTSTPIESGEGSVFVIPPSKRSQSPTVFSRVQLGMSVVTDSSLDLEPPKIFYYARSTKHMMRKMGYNLQSGNGLNFEKGRRDFL